MPERRANSSQKLLPRRSRSSTVQGRGGKWLKRQTVRVLEVLIKGLERLVEQLESETAPEKLLEFFLGSGFLRRC
ncbi:MAG: hypothetical protein HC825_08980 [Oscillatoriales cyanobacterium RM1_1_9]|nr:hypothetical protein [Oscillatoriales cyanobacterium RM1_1_9]